MARLFVEKAFLNQDQHHFDASVMVILKEHSYELFIRDCKSDLRIANDIDTPEKRENGLHKLDTLINALSTLRDKVKDAPFIDEN
jgi:hypothetical protein